MASSYVNDLRLNEMATGDASGTWGTTTNTNLELIGEALGYGTEGITTNADTHTTTVADGATDPGRAMYIEYTGTLDSACTITIAPNTLSRMHFIENGTSGSQNIIIKQGSGATITIPPGDTKAVYLDGAGSGAAVVDAFASLSVVDLKVQDDLTVTDDLIVGGDIDLEGAIDVNGTANLDVVDIDGAVDMASNLTIAGDIDLAGGIDVDGTSNLDIVDIDGAVDMASTLQVDGVATFTGRDIHSGGITIANAGQIGSVGDTDAIAIASDGVVTLTQKLVGTELDISGNVDVDGTTETDVLTINGSQLNYKAFGTSSIMFGDNATGTIDAANYNTGVGVDVFAALTTGDENTSIGFAALGALTTGEKNVAVGHRAGAAIDTGVRNVLIGDDAGDALTSAGSNVAIGYQALGADTLGQHSVALGQDALSTQNFTTATNVYNTAIGSAALASNTTGIYNTAVGGLALSANQAGQKHTALGYGALQDLTGGEENTAVGYLAGENMTTASGCVAVGQEALKTLQTGNFNIAIGREALLSVNGAADNVAMGKAAGENITTGVGNTCIGKVAGDGITTSGSNTLIGRDSDTSSSTSAGHEIAIGANAIGKGASTGFINPNGGGVFQGNNSTTWSQTSDIRIKKNIVDNNVGLEKIKDIQVRNFEYKLPEEISDGLTETDAIDKQGIQLGVIAQELETILPDMVKTESTGVKTVNPDNLTWYLVNAVKELSAKVKELESKLNEE